MDEEINELFFPFIYQVIGVRVFTLYLEMHMHPCEFDLLLLVLE